MTQEVIKELALGDAKLTLKTGKIAKQADGSILISLGDTVVLAAVCIGKNKTEGHFLPLTVDYREMSYAAGKIPGGFFKRETKASMHETLVSRFIDRSLRPLFPDNFYQPVQITCTVLSYDPCYPSDILSIIGASAALTISGIKIDPIAAARIGYVDNEFVINPNREKLKHSKLNLVVAGTKESTVMVEAEAHQLSEEQVLEAITVGHQYFQPIIDLITELAQIVAKEELRFNIPITNITAEAILEQFEDQIKAIFAEASKQKRYMAFEELRAAVVGYFNTDNDPANVRQILTAMEEAESKCLRQQIIHTNTRIDGRNVEQIRPIDCEVNLLPRTHGSALFTRGETQSIATATLGTVSDQQIVENLDHWEHREHFLLHYIFTPYSVGEASPIKAPNRREIGHGKLAWHALNPVMPAKEAFPHTVRVVSEITESNGSSSMATVCGASLALMDAGVPISAPVAGIAMGLIKEGDKFVVLSDILGDEDHLGDMDFKVAGTADGVTALQVDVKVKGITLDIIRQALTQARQGRLHILNIMNRVLSEPRLALSQHAPVVHRMKIDKDKIRELIGPSGKVIREICDTTKSKIDISDEGVVQIHAPNKESLEHAINRVSIITIEPKPGNILNGKIVKLVDFGAFIDYGGSKDGFIHISEITEGHIEDINQHLSIDQQVAARVIGIDRTSGKVKLSLKAQSSAADAGGEHKVHSPRPPKPTGSSTKPTSKDKDKAPRSESGKTERKYFN